MGADDAVCTVVCLILLFCAGVVGHIIGFTNGRGAMQDEAAQQRHAEYYLDDNNERQWRWLPAPPKGEAK